MKATRGISRRDFVVTTLAVGGGLALGFSCPKNEAERAALAVRLSGRPWESLAGKSDVEVGPWLMIAPDDTVTIRVGQSEMGQGVITSCAKMVAEELECDERRVGKEWRGRGRGGE